MSIWYFACDSDQHFEYSSGNPISRKGNFMNQIVSLKQQHNIDLLLSVGDATQNGADGSSFCCCKSNQFGNEYQLFMENYVDPIEKMGISTKICIGNHDINKWKFPNIALLKFIRDKYNATYSWCNTDEAGYYTFIHKGFRFICLGLYPKNIDWLKKNLPNDKVTPIIIFYHYNTDPIDPYADWWSDDEKDKFYNAIAEYNVKLIINGHMHMTKQGLWKNIPYLVCANGPVLIEVNNLNVVIP